MLPDATVNASPFVNQSWYLCGHRHRSHAQERNLHFTVAQDCSKLDPDAAMPL